MRQHTSTPRVGAPPEDNDDTVGEETEVSEAPGAEVPAHGSGDKESLERYLHEIAQWQLLSVEGEQALARRAATGDPVAREEMVHRNLRLVVYWVKRYRATGLPIQDLIQEGNIGLMRAVEKFNPWIGTRFSTYASWWIRQALSRAICDKQDIIRIPVHMHQKMRTIDQLLDSKGGQRSSDSDIENAVNASGIIPFKDWESARRLQQSVSLDRRPDPGRDDPIDIADQKAVTPMHGVYLREIKEQVSQLLKELPKRHRAVLNLRYGLDGHGEHTLESIGATLHISRERVRQIQAEAIARLAEWTSSAGHSGAWISSSKGRTLLSRPRCLRERRESATVVSPDAVVAVGPRRRRRAV